MSDNEGLETDKEGYLVNPENWTPDFARSVATGESIDLTDEHWSVIEFMRTFQEEHQVAPDARFVIRFLSENHGAGRNRLFELFPYGYVQQACKMAGMKRPRAWSTG